MSRVPYHILVDEANYLIEMAAFSPSDGEYYWQMYHALIDGCGWTDEEFDAETLSRTSNYLEQVSIGNVVPIRFGKKCR
jgi:hypothetical protein